MFVGLGRLRPGVGVAQAQAALTAVAKRLEQLYSDDRRKRPVVQGLEAMAQGPARQTMGLLAVGVGLVFLVGCVESRHPDGSGGQAPTPGGCHPVCVRCEPLAFVVRSGRGKMPAYAAIGGIRRGFCVGNAALAGAFGAGTPDLGRRWCTRRL